MATPRATNRYTSSDVLAFFNGNLEFPSLSDHESDMEVEEGSGQSNVDEPVDDLSEKSTSEDEESTGEDEESTGEDEESTGEDETSDEHSSNDEILDSEDENDTRGNQRRGNQRGRVCGVREGAATSL